MSTLVTGGTGFLGLRLAKRLRSSGREVTVLARRAPPELGALGIRVITTSLDDASAVSAACAGMETVFHVAAKVGVWGRYEDFYRTNVLGTRALLKGCRAHGVKYFVHTSTPSVVYNGRDLAGADESLPLTRDCPSPYPLTKALAEAEVLAANDETLRTTALRPHLIWGVGDPHLVPRILERARAGKLRIVGSGKNRVDMVHVENAVDAHLLAEEALRAGRAAGRAYFITNGEPVVLWDWINELLAALGEQPVKRRVSLTTAKNLGALCEWFWRITGRRGEPPMTRFIAAELAKDHWFNIEAARRDLNYAPKVSMAEGTRMLVEALRR
ncbi:MAG TPA: NAD-dependent epimerase/dehydratase family protein [Opitutaceae bacterium]|nr:NAD-dependent epimerase/dehydratase family protein [Opitutaceae bacterium]